MKLLSKNFALVALAVSALCCASCQKPEQNPEPEPGPVEILPESHPDMDLLEDFPQVEGFILNPERGLYTTAEFRRAGAALSASDVRNARDRGFSLYLLEFYLTNYMESDIDAAYLKMVEDSFNALREGGMKCVLRFAYTSNQSASVYDATLEWALRHIASLKPLLQKHSDVIAVMQCGFVGCWGEWYYTTNFHPNAITYEHYAERRALVEALLDALPSNREISMRCAKYKFRVLGTTLADSLTFETAHNGSAIARLSAHNDCFGASGNDLGTFTNKDDRELWMNDCRYQFMGGETCQVSPYCECVHALEDVKNYHWTYLNNNYNRNVLNKWKEGECYDEIIDHLGYRLAVKKAWMSKEPKAGESFSLFLRMENSGYCAPVNPRAAELVFVDGAGKKTVIPMPDCDPRTWHSNVLGKADATFTIPADAKGLCTIYLNLPDPEKALRNDPRYSIRLANADCWDAATGYNKVAEIVL